MTSARHPSPRLTIGALALLALAGLARPARAVAPDSNSVVSAASPGAFVTTVNPAVRVAVTLTRGVTTPILGYSVTFTLSGLTSSAAAIGEGGFLTASGGTTSFHV